MKRSSRLTDKIELYYVFFLGIMSILFGIYWLTLYPRLGEPTLIRDASYTLTGAMLILGGLLELNNLRRIEFPLFRTVDEEEPSEELGKCVGKLISLSGMAVFFSYAGYYFQDYILIFFGGGGAFLFILGHIRVMERRSENPYFNKWTHKILG